MKNYFLALIIASALTISVVIIRQNSQAQNNSSQPIDRTGAMMADAVRAKTKDQASSPIFVTEIPPGYRDWRLISVAHEEGNLNSRLYLHPLLTLVTRTQTLRISRNP